MRLFHCFLLLLLNSSAALANHILGGYIQAKRVSNTSLTYEITVRMYYDPAFRDGEAPTARDITICLGDGASILLGPTRLIPWSVDPKSLSINEYTSVYTYAGPGTYTIQATTFNRSGATNLGTSESVFLVKTTFSAIPYLGTNSTHMLALPSYGIQLVANQRAVLNMAATDPENDSLAYVLSAPITSVDSQTANLCNTAIPVSLYRFPNDVNHVGIYRLNAKTGLLTWDSPTEQGRYVIALTVSEWRNGVNISETRQELTLTVVDKGGTPVTPPPYEPAVAGFLTAVDNNAPDELKLTV